MKTPHKPPHREQDLETKALNEITAKPSLTVDYDTYAHLLENSDMSEQQKRQFIQALWSVIYGFASLGFGVHPVQHVENRPCGQVEKSPQNSPTADRINVEFKNTSKMRGSTKRHVADQSGVEDASR